MYLHANLCEATCTPLPLNQCNRPVYTSGRYSPIWFLPGVDPLVYFESVRERETFAADLTLVRPLTRVSHHVFPQ